MKRIAIAFCLLLLLALPLHAQEYDYCAGAGGAAALVCSGATVQQQEISATGASNLGSAAGNKYRATQFTAGFTGTLCRFDAQMDCNGTGCVQIITGYVLADSGSDTPGTVLSTCTGTYDTTPLTSADAWVSFTGCSASTSNGTKYWLMWMADAVDASNYSRLISDNDCATEKHGYSADGSSWSYVTTECFDHKIYILE